MPHLIVYATEGDLRDRESALIEALTEAVVAVYGEWAREIAVVQLIGLPRNRWGIGGQVVAAPAPRVTFGIKAGAFVRPDATEIITGLAGGVTEALVSVIGEQIRAGTTVEFVGTPEGRASVGGQVV